MQNIFCHFYQFSADMYMATSPSVIIHIYLVSCTDCCPSSTHCCSRLPAGSTVTTILEQKAVPYEAVLEVVPSQLWTIPGTTTSILCTYSLIHWETGARKLLDLHKSKQGNTTNLNISCFSMENEKIAAQVGFEPTTYCLRGRCSTN